MATTVVERTLEKLDWKQLLAEVDETFRTWRTEGLIIPGGADPLIKLDEPFQWLESKRTCLKVSGVALPAEVPQGNAGSVAGNKGKKREGRDGVG